MYSLVVSKMHVLKRTLLDYLVFSTNCIVPYKVHYNRTLNGPNTILQRLEHDIIINMFDMVVSVVYVYF